ncbi:hypothetical protein Tco_0318102 [Tanacetum coccineum]
MEVFSDFGPTPFRFYHSWLELPGFDDLVSKFWNSFTLDDSNGMIRFKKASNVEEGDSSMGALDFKKASGRFQDPGSRQGSLNFPFPNRLNNDQILELESPISNEDIRIAVWGCGVDKIPWADGVTFGIFSFRVGEKVQVQALERSLDWRYLLKLSFPRLFDLDENKEYRLLKDEIRLFPLLFVMVLGTLNGDGVFSQDVSIYVG